MSEAGDSFDLTDLHELLKQPAPKARAKPARAKPATRVEMTMPEETLPPLVAVPVAKPSRRQPATEASTVRDDAVPFHPRRRSPTGMLCILDDGNSEKGEWRRLRGERFTFGRSNACDVSIPHDVLMSNRHAEITCAQDAKGYAWHLHDLKSTNGTFVRIPAEIGLDADAELILGAIRYRFVLPEIEHQKDEQTTQGWDRPASDANKQPALLELTPEGTGKEYPLIRPEQWFGREPGQHGIAVADELLSRKHAWFRRDDAGRWHVRCGGGRNGVWMRVRSRVRLGHVARFQLGEQRFFVRVGS